MVDAIKNTRVYTTWGTKTARPVQPKVAAKTISKAKRPLMVVGAELLKDKEALNRAVKIAKVLDILGHKKYYINQVLSGLKNFTNLKTISIDKHYLQNATMSFGNLDDEKHHEALDELIENL